jgi:hypothetical protein
MKQIFISLFIIATVGLHTPYSYSQCNGFTKKKCLPTLKPFIHNGQLNSTVLVAGETAELLMTFYSGQEYRILVCGQEELGGTEFRLLDNARKVIFASKEHKNAKMWDFNVKSTQQITVEVIAPPSSGPHNNSGCVSVLVGFKK